MNAEKESINYYGIRQIAVLSHTRGVISSAIVMQALTDEQELSIDKHNTVIFKNTFGDRVAVDYNHVLLYGAIDFDDPSDVSQIENLDCIDNTLSEKTDSWIPADFDYNSGLAFKENGVIKQYRVNDFLRFFKFSHCLIGKPNKIIIYKIIINKLHR